MSQLILVVDDDVDYLTQMRMQLEAKGYAVHTEDTAEAAKEWIKSNQPVLAIVDLMIEDFDAGFSLCHCFKDQHPNLPVVMVTGVAAETGIQFDASTRKDKSWIKADAVLNKPVRFEQLQREMNRLIKPGPAAQE